jgi:hypothetical protein
MTRDGGAAMRPDEVVNSPAKSGLVLTPGRSVVGGLVKPRVGKVGTG